MLQQLTEETFRSTFMYCEYLDTWRITLGKQYPLTELPMSVLSGC